MTLGSLFDGLGGWQLAAVRNGIKPLWSSEIDEFCMSVTRRHFPDTVQLGDINGIEDASHVDIITAGSPCQDISIAGKRSGINGERSGLFFRAVELVRRIRPEFFVWENVPGVLSSNGRLDFKTVLEEILQEPVPLPRHWSNAGVVDGQNCQIAWRILDAQFFGVPQRRRRIFLVADFTARRAAQILFEPTSLRGNSPQGKSSQQDTAARTRNRADTSVFCIQGNTIDRRLKNGANGKGVLENISYTLNTIDRHAVVYDNHGQDCRITRLGEIAPTVSAKYGTGGNNTPLVAYGIGRDAFNQGVNAKFNPTIERELQPPHGAWCRRLCHAVNRQAAHALGMRKTSRLARLFYCRRFRRKTLQGTRQRYGSTLRRFHLETNHAIFGLSVRPSR